MRDNRKKKMTMREGEENERKIHRKWAIKKKEKRTEK